MYISHQNLKLRKKKSLNYHINQNIVKAYYRILASLVAQRVRHLPAMQETQVRFLGWEDPLEKEIATHSNTLAWKILWMEKPGRLQSMGLQRVGHDWVTSLHFTKYALGKYTKWGFVGVDLHAGFGPLSSSVLRLQDKVCLDQGSGVTLSWSWAHCCQLARSWVPIKHMGSLDTMGLVLSPTGGWLWPGSSTSTTSVTRIS